VKKVAAFLDDDDDDENDFIPKTKPNGFNPPPT